MGGPEAPLSNVTEGLEGEHNKQQTEAEHDVTELSNLHCDGLMKQKFKGRRILKLLRMYKNEVLHHTLISHATRLVTNKGRFLQLD